MKLTTELIDLIVSGEARQNDITRFIQCFIDDFRAYWEEARYGNVKFPLVFDEKLLYYHESGQTFYIKPKIDNTRPTSYLVVSTTKGERCIEFELDGYQCKLNNRISLAEDVRMYVSNGIFESTGLYQPRVAGLNCPLI